MAQSEPAENHDEQQQPVIFVNDAELCDLIHTMLAAADIHVQKEVIRIIMQYQTNNYENLGLLKIVYQ